MKRMLVPVAVAVLLACAAFAAQKNDPAIDKVAQQYATAFNNGDAKALVALYTDDAFRLTPDNQIIAGRAAIEGFYTSMFASKPAALTVRPGRTQLLGADVAVTEGTYELATGAKGVYVLTLVRQAGQWRIASAVPVADSR